jgi:hypothetical protein
MPGLKTVLFPLFLVGLVSSLAVAMHATHTGSVSSPATVGTYTGSVSSPAVVTVATAAEMSLAPYIAHDPLHATPRNNQGIFLGRSAYQFRPVPRPRWVLLHEELARRGPGALHLPTIT